MRNGQFYYPSRNKASWTTQCREISHSLPEPSDACMGWVGPPPSPHPLFLGETTKCNKSLKDPVRGAGSTQMQTRSYCARQSGNLTRKVRNAFPGSTALTESGTGKVFQLLWSLLYVQELRRISVYDLHVSCNLIVA